MATRDLLGRPLRNLRISVTDRCNLRCAYCMPEADYAWLPRRGHPALRGDRPARRRLHGTGRRPRAAHRRRAARAPGPRPPGLDPLGEARAARHRADDQRRPPRRAGGGACKAAGLHRVTVSLDTLDPDRFRELTRFDELPRVLAGIDAAVAAGFATSKIDSVVIRGVNDDELVALLERGRGVGRRGALHRVHGRRRRHALVARAGRLARRDPRSASPRRYGPIAPIVERARRRPSASACPTARSSASSPRPRRRSAGACDRSRLTADGQWYLCLYASAGIDLRAPLRAGRRALPSFAEILASAWRSARRPRRRGAPRPARPVPASAPRRARAATRTSRCTRAAAEPQRVSSSGTSIQPSLTRTLVPPMCAEVTAPAFFSTRASRTLGLPISTPWAMQ